ncbi:hypothetical protein PR048_019714 [Dryococelus australis]|uniref:Uncharacterized protein n=1 Tax=Dryococelus australis TaxID=614101 RepID=A0ABQ9H490_9NEOP|nr:hypothetical protein PR048_019714 [Dryococelus australis]
MIKNFIWKKRKRKSSLCIPATVTFYFSDALLKFYFQGYSSASWKQSLRVLCTETISVKSLFGHLIYIVKRRGGNTACLASRSDEALGVRVSVSCIAPSLLDIVRSGMPDTDPSTIFVNVTDATGCHVGRCSHPSLFVSQPGLDAMLDWESCRTMPLVGGFSRGSPISPAPSFRRRSILTSITHIGSLDLAVKSPLLPPFPYPYSPALPRFTHHHHSLPTVKILKIKDHVIFVDDSLADPDGSAVVTSEWAGTSDEDDFVERHVASEMVRSYKRTSDRGASSNEFTMEPVNEVLSVRMGYYKSASIFYVPQTTLERKATAPRRRNYATSQHFLSLRDNELAKIILRAVAMFQIAEILASHASHTTDQAQNEETDAAETICTRNDHPLAHLQQPTSNLDVHTIM